MKAPLIEFGTRRPAPAWWAVLLCLLALGCAADALWRLGSAQARQDEAQRAVLGARDLLALATPRRAPEVRASVPAERVAAVNRAVERLNLPWGRVFGALEATRGEDVALLTVDPEAARRLVKLSGEARTAAAMLSYVERLGAEGSFSRVSLVKHQVNEQDAHKPLRFQIEATWKEGL